jgi:hypothetical protein
MTSRPERIDNEFSKALKAIASERILKGLSKPIATELSLSEQTRLLMKTEGWKMSINELLTKPKKYE